MVNINIPVTLRGNAVKVLIDLKNLQSPKVCHNMILI